MITLYRQGTQRSPDHRLYLVWVKTYKRWRSASEMAHLNSADTHYLYDDDEQAWYFYSRTAREWQLQSTRSIEGTFELW